MTQVAKRKEQSIAFQKTATGSAAKLLTQWVGEERARGATGSMNAALVAVTTAARNPSDFFACTPESVANAVAIAALTGIMPGGNASTSLAYVVPRRPRKDAAPNLQYSLSHRGLQAVARRCGQTMIATPISKSDDIDVDEAGEVTIFRRDLDNPPMTYEELRGVVVTIKEVATGVTTSRNWVPKKLIDPRKAMSQAGNKGPWATWPIEMAMKTAMKYAVSRGWCVIDDTEAMRAISADDDDPNVIPTTATVRPTSLAAIGAEPIDEEPEPEPEKPKPQRKKEAEKKEEPKPSPEAWTVDRVIEKLANRDAAGVEALADEISGLAWQDDERAFLKEAFAGRRADLQGA